MPFTKLQLFFRVHRQFTGYAQWQIMDLRGTREQPRLLGMKLLGILTALTVQATFGLDQAAFEKLHRELQPDPKATWRTIPWKTSVLDAQAEAARTGKPIFIWAMDGHPLGCT